MTLSEALRIADYYSDLVESQKIKPARATEALIVLADYHAINRAHECEAERIVCAMDERLEGAIALGRAVIV